MPTGSFITSKGTEVYCIGDLEPEYEVGEIIETDILWMGKKSIQEVIDEDIEEMEIKDYIRCEVVGRPRLTFDGTKELWLRVSFKIVGTVFGIDESWQQ